MCICAEECGQACERGGVGGEVYVERVAEGDEDVCAETGEGCVDWGEGARGGREEDAQNADDDFVGERQLCWHCGGPRSDGSGRAAWGWVSMSGKVELTT